METDLVKYNDWLGNLNFVDYELDTTAYMITSDDRKTLLRKRTYNAEDGLPPGMEFDETTQNTLPNAIAEEENMVIQVHKKPAEAMRIENEEEREMAELVPRQKKSNAKGYIEFGYEY